MKRSHLSSRGHMSMAATALLLSSMSASFAANQVVINTDDSGAGSLRQAITDVAHGETITFDAALDGATITVTSVLTLDKSLTIDASGLAGGISISGNTVSRVFMINASVTANFSTLTIRDGKADNGVDGADGAGAYSVFSTWIAATNGSPGGNGEHGEASTIPEP